MPDTWGLMYLQFFVYCSITKSQAQYKYSTWHLGANGYLIKLCSKDSFLFFSPGLLMLKPALEGYADGFQKIYI